MEESYAHIEERLKQMTDINQIEEILPLLYEEGITVEDIDNVLESPKLYVGGMLMGYGGKIYLIKDLYDNISNFNNSIMTEEYLLDKAIMKMEPIKVIRYFSNVITVPSTDKEILDNAYRIQWKETYRKLLNIVEESIKNKTEMDLTNIEDRFKGLPLIKNKMDILIYKRFYLGIIKSLEFILVTLEDEAGRTFQHIKLDMDLNTGEVLLLINRSPGKKRDDWRRLLVPLNALPILLNLLDPGPLKVYASRMELLPTTMVGKISGFSVGSRLDKEIYKHLQIDRIYHNGKLLESDENSGRQGETNDMIVPKDDTGTANWFDM